MPVNPLTSNNFIDSCAFDPKYTPEDQASSKIFRLYKDGKILIQIAHSTQKEIEHPNTPAWVRSEALSMIYTLPVQLTEGEMRQLREIEMIIAGNGKVENILQDARHVFEAQKYGSYFVTTDSRILSRAHKLKSACNVIVLKPSEFLAIAKQFLARQGHQKIDSSVIQGREEVTKMDAVRYKGFLIQATPYQLADSGEFTINISILHDSGSAITSRNFSASYTFKTKHEAIQHCVEFGQQIIDGKVTNCTVADL